MRSYTVLATLILALSVLGLSGVIHAPSTLADDGGSRSGPGGAVAAKKKPKTDPALFAIGAVSASDVWTAYMFVAVTADHFVKDGYTRKQVEQLLKSRVGFNGKAVEALEKVATQVKITSGDKNHLRGLVGAYRALDAYSKSVLTYAADKSRANALASEAKRKAAWAKVRSALGIK